MFLEKMEKMFKVFMKETIFKSRTKEGLEQYKGYYKNKDLPTQTIINENGLLLHVDVENGQKTGYFLDRKIKSLFT